MPQLKFTVSVRFLADERDILYVLRTPKGDYYAALLNHPPQSPLKISRHASGLFHLKGGPNGTALPGTLPVRREPVGIFSGVEVLVHTGVLPGQIQAVKGEKENALKHNSSRRRFSWIHR